MLEVEAGMNMDMTINENLGHGGSTDKGKVL